MLNELDVLKSQIRDGHVYCRIVGTDAKGTVKRWVEVDAKPTEGKPEWTIKVVMGDGTKYDKQLPVDGLEEALVEFILKLKAAFGKKAKHGLS